MKEVKTNCFHFYKLSQVKCQFGGVYGLYKSGILETTGNGVCHQKFPLLNPEVGMIIDITCVGPSASGCPGFVHK